MTHPHRHLKRTALLAVAAMLIATFAALPARADDGLWLHVFVEESEGATVKVNLPLSFVETAIRMIPDEEMRDGRIMIDDEEITVAELRELWAELDDAGDASLVEVDDHGEKVYVRKRGGFLLVEVQEPGEAAQVNVRIPERVVDALLSAGSNELDVSAALRALAEEGEGELVTVNDSDARVRVWVDALASAE